MFCPLLAQSDSTNRFSAKNYSRVVPITYHISRVGHRSLPFKVPTTYYLAIAAYGIAQALLNPSNLRNMEESNAPVPRIESTDESGMQNLPAIPAIVDLPLTPALPAIVDLPLTQDWTEAWCVLQEVDFILFASRMHVVCTSSSSTL